jgi:ABC-type sulfate transport system permease subunit
VSTDTVVVGAIVGADVAMVGPTTIGQGSVLNPQHLSTHSYPAIPLQHLSLVHRLPFLPVRSRALSNGLNAAFRSLRSCDARSLFEVTATIVVITTAITSHDARS